MFAFFAYRAMRYQARFPLIARHALLLTMLAIIVYGASYEFHQRFVPGRTADVLDWLADSLGACAFVIVPWWKTRATHAAGTAD